MTMPSRIWAYPPVSPRRNADIWVGEERPGLTPYIRADDRRALAEALGLVLPSGHVPSEACRWVSDNFNGADIRRMVPRIVGAIIRGPDHD